VGTVLVGALIAAAAGCGQESVAAGVWANLEKARMGYEPGRWLAAAGLDRFLVFNDLDQFFGTQCERDSTVIGMQDGSIAGGPMRFGRCSTYHPSTRCGAERRGGTDACWQLDGNTLAGTHRGRNHDRAGIRIR
jgi:hypothetical protein